MGELPESKKRTFIGAVGDARASEQGGEPHQQVGSRVAVGSDIAQLVRETARLAKETAQGITALTTAVPELATTLKATGGSWLWVPGVVAAVLAILAHDVWGNRTAVELMKEMQQRAEANSKRLDTLEKKPEANASRLNELEETVDDVLFHLRDQSEREEWRDDAIAGLAEAANVQLRRRPEGGKLRIRTRRAP